MKLLRLDLLAFGPFTDVSLNLDQGQEGLHLIYGPNEAGKSSALRALRQLFYGIEERTTDAFLHPYDKLRLGGKVRHHDGSVLELVRRKARVNPLRGADDRAIIDGAELARFLGGLDEKLFQSMFGIDHKTLVSEGKNIAQGGGQVGEILFAAGSGIADLRQLQDGLKAEVDELFKPAGRNQKITQALHQLRDMDNSVRRLQLSSDVWMSHENLLTEARQRKAQVDSELQQVRRDQERLKRMDNALPAIAKRKGLQAELQTCGDAPLLPADFADKRREALAKLHSTEERAKNAQSALEQIEAELRQLHIPPALLERSDKFEALYRKLGEYEKDMKDRPERELQRKTLEHEAKNLLVSLGKPPQLEAAEQLRLPANEPIKIQDLGNQWQGLLADLKNANDTASQVTRRITQTRQEIAELELPPEPTALRGLLRQLQPRRAAEEQLQTERAKLEKLEADAAIDLRRLPPWSGTLEALEQLPVPAPESLESWEKGVNDVNNEKSKLEERLQEEEQKLAALESELARLELEQDVPSEDDLKAARQRRDLGWQLVRRAWLDDSEDSAAVAEFINAIKQSDNLAQAYERSVESADRVADRLRGEAARVAAKAKLVVDRRDRNAHRQKWAEQLQAAQIKLDELDRHWRALWAPLGIQPLSAHEMRAWLRRQGELARTARLVRDQRLVVERMSETITSSRKKLSACLDHLGQPPAPPQETLVSLLDRSQEVVEEFDRIKDQRAHLQREIVKVDSEALATDSQIKRAEKDLATWTLQWAKAMSRLGLPEDSKPAEANAFLGKIVELFQKLDKADDFHRRIVGMDRDTQKFADDVRSVAQLSAPDLEALPVERTVEELYSRLKKARKADQDQQRLHTQLAREKETRRLAQEASADAAYRLEAMCQEAACATPADLPGAEQRSFQRRQLEKDIGQLETHLLSLSGGATLAELLSDAMKVDADGLKSDLQRGGERVTALEREISQLDQTIGAEERELAGMDGSAKAAQAAEDAENVLAQLRVDVERYAVVKSAAFVLREGIKRCREKFQTPILARASQLFADLTAGSFAALHVEYNEHGEPILVGIRGGSRDQVGVQAMSDGSCDQLYLALRLAFLEDYLHKNHEPIPFIVDDILLNFDNDRAVAALNALVELSRRTQVIFFTHHQHLVEMAKRSLQNDKVFAHRLPGRRSNN